MLLQVADDDLVGDLGNRVRLPLWSPTVMTVHDGGRLHIRGEVHKLGMRQSIQSRRLAGWSTTSPALAAGGPFWGTIRVVGTFGPGAKAFERPPLR